MNDPTQNNDSRLTVFEVRFGELPIRGVVIAGRRLWPARHIGERLGYSQRGKALVTLVTREWADEFHEGEHFIRADKSDLAGIARLFASAYSAPAKVRGMVMLTEEGVYKALIKTEKPMGVAMREWFAARFMPQVARDGRYSPDRQVVAGQIVDRDITPDNIVEEPVNGARLHVEHGRPVGYDLVDEDPADHLPVREQLARLDDLTDLLEGQPDVHTSVLRSLRLDQAELATGRDLTAYRVAVLGATAGRLTATRTDFGDDEPTVERDPIAASVGRTYEELRERVLDRLAAVQTQTRDQLAKLFDLDNGDRWILFRVVGDLVNGGHVVETDNPDANKRAKLLKLAEPKVSGESAEVH